MRERVWKDVLIIQNGRSQKKVVSDTGNYPIYGSGGKMGYATEALCPANTTIIGRKGSINSPIYVSEPFWNVDTAFGLIAKSDLEPKYLYYFCLQYNFLKHNKATTLPSLTKTDLLRIKIPLPPLPTQHRIAAALDLADRQRQLLRAEIAAYGELGESLFLEMFGDPTQKSLKFPSTKLGDLGRWKSGGTPSRNKPEYFTGSIPWLSSGELNEMYNAGDSKEQITETAISESSAKIIEPGSLLLGMYDTAALKSTITTTSSSCNQAIAYAKLFDHLANVVFVYYVVQIGKEHFRRLQRGVRQKNLNLSMIKSLRIPLPPVKMQNGFANRIQKIEAIKAQAETALAEADDLFHTLLQRAFRGELFT